jgi:hypothetical protein
LQSIATADEARANHDTGTQKIHDVEMPIIPKQKKFEAMLLVRMAMVIAVFWNLKGGFL